MRPPSTAWADALALVGYDERIVFANEAFAALCARDGEKVRGRKLAALFEARFLEDELAPLLGRAFAGETLTTDVDVCPLGHAPREVTSRLSPASAASPRATTVAWSILERLPAAQPASATHPDTTGSDALGRFAGAVAHDLNNILVGIVGGVDLLREALVSGPTTIHRELELVGRSIERASRLCRTLLCYTARTPDAVPVDLEAAVVRLLDSLKRDRAELTLRVVEQPAPASLHLLADPFQVDRAIEMLAANAIDALEKEAGTVDIAIGIERDLPLDRDLAVRPAGAAACYQYIELTDSGHGMDHATRRYMFEPFFTTRPRRRGLGLTLVRAIARAHDAAIQVESTVGAGTTVRLFFPLSESS